MIKESFPIPHKITVNASNNPNFLTILDSYSTRQTLAQTSLNSLQEYDGSNKDMTIEYLDHIEMVAEKTGIDPLEVGITKLRISPRQHKCHMKKKVI